MKTRMTVLQVPLPGTGPIWEQIPGWIYASFEIRLFPISRSTIRFVLAAPVKRNDS